MHAGQLNTPIEILKKTKGQDANGAVGDRRVVERAPAGEVRLVIGGAAIADDPRRSRRPVRRRGIGLDDPERAPGRRAR